MFIKNFYTIILFFALYQTLFTGFGPETVITTNNDYTSIQNIFPGDKVLSFNVDLQTIVDATVVYAVENVEADIYTITVNNETICISSKQKLFDTQNNYWIYPNKINTNTFLLAAHNRSFRVQKIEHYVIPTTMYQISLAYPHTYFIGKTQLLTHNFFVLGIGFAFGVGGIEFTGITAGLLTALGVIGLKFAKDKHSRFSVRPQINDRDIFPAPQGSPKKPKKDDEDDEKRKHPHGKYKDAQYHHQNSTGAKSPAPIDGQKALDNSIEVHKSEGRIAIEGDKFVVLGKTSEGLYHGHLRTWSELAKKMQQSLQRSGLTNHRGKFIK